MANENPTIKIINIQGKNYELIPKQATVDEFGGIKADTVTKQETEEVKIDSESGKLYSKKIPVNVSELANDSNYVLHQIDNGQVAIGNTVTTQNIGGVALGNNAKSIGIGSIAIGSNTESREQGGVAIGDNTKTGRGVALGRNSMSTNGGAVGYLAKTEKGASVGSDAVSGFGVSLGYVSHVANKPEGGTDANGNPLKIDAIQLGHGFNADDKTLQAYNYNIMDKNGTLYSYDGVAAAAEDISNKWDDASMKSASIEANKRRAKVATEPWVKNYLNISEYTSYLNTNKVTSLDLPKEATKIARGQKEIYLPLFDTIMDGTVTQKCNISHATSGRVDNLVTDLNSQVSVIQSINTDQVRPYYEEYLGGWWNIKAPINITFDTMSYKVKKVILHISNSINIATGGPNEGKVPTDYLAQTFNYTYTDSKNAAHSGSISLDTVLTGTLPANVKIKEVAIEAPADQFLNTLNIAANSAPTTGAPAGFNKINLYAIDFYLTDATTNNYKWERILTNNDYNAINSNFNTINTEVEQNKQQFIAAKTDLENSHTDLQRQINSLGNIQVYQAATQLPVAREKFLNKIFRYNNTFYQCIKQGAGKAYNWNLDSIKGTAEITDFTEFQIATEGLLQVDAYASIHVFNNNGSLKFGSSKLGGILRFTYSGTEPLYKLLLTFTAYRTDKASNVIIKRFHANAAPTDLPVETFEYEVTTSLAQTIPFITPIYTNDIIQIESVRVAGDTRIILDNIQADCGNYTYLWYPLTTQQNVTYDELVALRDRRQLIPGMSYRITDYETTVNPDKTSICAANNVFDIIVTADDNQTLNANAKACKSARNSIADCIVGYLETDIINSDISYLLAKAKFKCIKADVLNKITNQTTYAIYLENNEYYHYSMDEEQGYYFEGEIIIDGESYYMWKRFETDVNTGKQFYAEGPTPTVLLSSWDILDKNCYFGTSNLAMWQLKYSLDNTALFDWCDEAGKGVIYYMKDEFGNEAPYDFKNILFERTATWFNEHQYWCNDILGYIPTTSLYFYTFSWFDTDAVIKDLSIYKANIESGYDKHEVFNNKISSVIEVYSNYTYYILPNNIYVDSFRYDSSASSTIKNNIIKNNSKNNTFSGQTSNNIIGVECSNNVCSEFFENNIIEAKCSDNIFGSSFESNYLNLDCSYNTFGYDFSYSTLGARCCRLKFQPHCSNITVQNNNRYAEITASDSSYPYLNNIIIYPAVLNGTYNAIQQVTIDNSNKDSIIELKSKNTIIQEI